MSSRDTGIHASARRGALRRMSTSGGDLTHPQTRETIINYVTTANFSGTTAVRDAVRAIVYLVLTCPEFAIQK